MAKILFVDDQINVLNSLKRTVEDEDCEVYTALSAKDGLKLVKEHTFDVIFSDIKMPELDGVAFLAETRKIQPDSVRVVLSAYADREQVLKAVNKGFIWSYQTKPWDSDDLILTLRNGLDFYQHQIENKRLAHELQNTNEQLTALNNKLDVKVQERTQELLMREEALTMLINNKDLDAVWAKIEKDLLIISHSSKVKIFEDKPNDFAGDLREVPHQGKCIGYIGFVKPKSGCFKRIDGFLPIIEILLSMSRVLKNEDEIMDNIDNLIKSLE